MAHQSVSLRDMTAQEYAAWRERAVESYAQDLVRATGRPIDDARVRAAAEFDQLLPDGMDSPGSHVMVVQTTDGRDVGTLWLGPHPTRGDHAYVFDVIIDEDWRGQGFGRATMLAAEEVVRRDGKSAVGLNVFGFNRGAQHLYESLGYEVVSTQMVKKLGRPGRGNG